MFSFNLTFRVDNNLIKDYRTFSGNFLNFPSLPAGRQALRGGEMGVVAEGLVSAHNSDLSPEDESVLRRTRVAATVNINYNKT